MKKIKGILIDTGNGIKQVSTTPDAIVCLLKCKYMTCVSRRIGDECVDIYCDEEALLKPARDPAVITTKGNDIVEVLYGNCFVCNHFNNGNVKSLKRATITRLIDASVCVALENNKYLCLKCNI